MTVSAPVRDLLQLALGSFPRSQEEKDRSRALLRCAYRGRTRKVRLSIVENCGGPGSGKPGPCPDPSSEEGGSGSGTIKDKNGVSYPVKFDSRTRTYYIGVPGKEDLLERGVTAGSAQMKANGVSVSALGIHPEFRRKGLATALYDHIEKHIGRSLLPNWALTDDGVAFWKSRQKPTANARPLKTDIRIKELAPYLHDLLGDVTKRDAKAIARIVKRGVERRWKDSSVARAIVRSTKIEPDRAKVIARTEMARARTDVGLGKKRDSDKVVFTIGNKDRACPICRKLAGKVYTVRKAAGVIPRHPNCFCFWSDAPKGARVSNANPKGCNQYSGKDCANDRVSMADVAVRDKWVRSTAIRIGNPILGKSPEQLTDAQYNSLPIVYHGGDATSEHIFVTDSAKLAASHGDVKEFRLSPGATLYADPESQEELEAMPKHLRRGHVSLRLPGGGSAIVKRSELWPKNRNDSQVSNVFCATGEGGGVDPGCEKSGSGKTSTIFMVSGEDVDFSRFSDAPGSAELEIDKTAPRAFQKWQKSITERELQSYGAWGVGDLVGSDRQELKDPGEQYVLDQFKSMVDRAPKTYDGIAYRGVNLSPESLSELKVGGSIDVKGLTSFASDRSVAERYSTESPLRESEGVPVLLEGSIKGGVEIGRMSKGAAYKGENGEISEVLIDRGALKIKAIRDHVFDGPQGKVRGKIVEIYHAENDVRPSRRAEKSSSGHPHAEAIESARRELESKPYRGKLDLGARIAAKLYKDSRISLSGAEVSSVLKTLIGNSIAGPLVVNVFCATGEGGGVDPSCGANGPKQATTSTGATVDVGSKVSPKRQKQVLQDADAIKVDEQLVHAGNVKEDDLEEIENLMTPEELDKLNYEIDQERESFIESELESFEPSEFDERDWSRYNGYQSSDIRNQVDSKLENWDDITKEKLGKVVNDWYAANRRNHGVDALDDLRNRLADADAPTELNNEMDEWYSEVKDERDEAAEQWENEQQNEARSSAEDNFDSDDAKERFLRQFYRDNEDDPRFSGDKTFDVWGKDPDGSGDNSLYFQTSKGAEYQVWDQSRRLNNSDLKWREIGFNDDSGSFSVTGAGNAVEVFSKASASVVSLLKNKDYPVASFTAAEESRQRLYDRMVKTISSVLPEYSAFAHVVSGAPKRYIVVKKNKVEEVRALFAGQGGTTEVLANEETKRKDGQRLVPIEPELRDEWFTEAGWTADKMTSNVFCATGEGGGIDPSCGSFWGKGTRSAVEEAHDSAIKRLGAMSKDREHAIVIDSKTGKILREDHGEPSADWTNGEVHSVPRPHHKIDSEAIVQHVHTHMDALSSFSDGDWANFANKNVEKMSVIDRSYVYTLTKDQDYINAAKSKYTPRELKEAWNEELARIESSTSPNDKPLDDYVGDLIHETNVNLAKRFGFTYTRRKK